MLFYIFVLLFIIIICTFHHVMKYFNVNFHAHLPSSGCIMIDTDAFVVKSCVLFFKFSMLHGNHVGFLRLC